MSKSLACPRNLSRPISGAFGLDSPMSVLKVTGKVTPCGNGHLRQRMTSFPDVFEQATGEKLIPGTLNVRVEMGIPIREHFRIQGSRIGEREQDLLFEVCRINRTLWGYRIRPYQVLTGEGGHGDHILEITCSTRIPSKARQSPSTPSCRVLPKPKVSPNSSRKSSPACLSKKRRNASCVKIAQVHSLNGSSIRRRSRTSLPT
jgi:hypothetical protein